MTTGQTIALVSIRDFACVDCGKLPNHKHKTVRRKRCLECYKKNARHKIHAGSFGVLKTKLARLPKDMRDVVKLWLSKRHITNEFEQRTFILDAISTVTRAVECEYKCCAGKSREQRLRECRGELCN